MLARQFPPRRGGPLPVARRRQIPEKMRENRGLLLPFLVFSKHRQVDR
jgi:hypothetical protein